MRRCDLQRARQGWPDELRRQQEPSLDGGGVYTWYGVLNVVGTHIDDNKANTPTVGCELEAQAYSQWAAP